MFEMSDAVELDVPWFIAMSKREEPAMRRIQRMRR